MPNNTITPEQYEMVKRFLEEGKLAKTDIATKTGVTGRIITKIKEGENVLVGPAQNPKRIGKKKDKNFIPSERYASHGRCPGCGGLVVFPCRACKTKAEMATMSRSSQGVEESADLSLKLEELDEKWAKGYKDVLEMRGKGIILGAGKKKKKKTEETVPVPETPANYGAPLDLPERCPDENDFVEGPK
jgi:hypothetical protein